MAMVIFYLLSMENRNCKMSEFTHTHTHWFLKTMSAYREAKEYSSHLLM